MIADFLWSPKRAAEALAQVAQQSGLLETPLTPTLTVASEQTYATSAELSPWLDEVAGELGIETEAVYVTYTEVTAFVQQSAPALIWLTISVPPLHAAQPNETTPREMDRGLLVLLRCRRQRVALLKPDLSVRWVEVATVSKWLCQTVEARHLETVMLLLEQVGLQGKAREQTQQALLRQQIGNQPVVHGWVVRLTPGAPVVKQFWQFRIQHSLLLMLASYVAQLGVTIATWWLIGGNALQGDLPQVWLWAWALLLFTAIPVRLLTEQAQYTLVKRLSLVSKQRLLYGILKLKPESIRHQGAGQFLGQVMETDLFDDLALGGGLIAGLAFLQAGMALALLTVHSPHLILPVLFLGLLFVLALLLWLYLYRQRAWLTIYRKMNSDLIERMVGHRTRLAQEPPEQWHTLEDLLLTHYIRCTAQVDRVKIWLLESITRIWMVLAFAGLSILFWLVPINQLSLPLAVAGILSALQALTSISSGIISLINAANVWDQVRPLFAAAQERSDSVVSKGYGPEESVANPLRPLLPIGQVMVNRAEISHPSLAKGQPLLIARDLEFRYRSEGRPIVHEGNLQIRQGDRLLLQGVSGGGKSTLAALFAGLRLPSSGLLLLHGHDQQTLGAEAWRRRVMLTPQFHENYIFNGSLAFNLLMGRCWPPQPEDLLLALELCQELGLGELIARMPAGLQQMMGENGWRLSHGERSRVYIARTLLQRADLMILDESFAALDPETMRTTLACVLRHAPTLMVIAHP